LTVPISTAEFPSGYLDSSQRLGQGCQIFRGTIYQNGENIPNDHKVHQSSINCTKWPENLPNDNKIYQTLPWQEPPKFAKIGIFGLKINHLATLGWVTLTCRREGGKKVLMFV
jgi:hypothetical protein